MAGEKWNSIPAVVNGKPFNGFSLEKSRDGSKAVLTIWQEGILEKLEGVGIRAIERLVGLNRRTVLNILEVEGRQCALVLDRKVRNIKAGSIGAIRRVFKREIDYGTEIKTYGCEIEGQRRYSAPVCTGVKRAAWIGEPKRDMICTSHAERTNDPLRGDTKAKSALLTLASRQENVLEKLEAILASAKSGLENL